MYLKMGQKLSQKMNLSPQMLQSIQLLSLSITEIEQVIRKELEENPVLEEKGETLEDLSPVEREELEEHLNWTQYTSTEIFSPDAIKKGAVTQAYEREAVSITESLRDHLIWQINFSNFSVEEKKILYFIVNEINEDGYLKETVQNIASANNFEVEKIHTLLNQLHEFDPPGVGARNLKECLLIQAKRIEEDTKDMVKMIQDHLEDLQTKDYNKIASSMSLDVEEVKQLADIITSMDPIPGRMFSSNPVEYIVPDIYIFKKSDNTYDVSINEDGMPQIRIASHYTQFLSNIISSSTPVQKGAQRYLTDKMKRAFGFIRSLNQRRDTILKLARIVAEEQIEFFEKGEKFLRPLLQREMSQKIGVAISTISRIVTNKFVHTPQGVFELKYFFGISYLNKEGNRLSVDTVKSMITNIISKEGSSLSDDKISKILFEREGLDLSRRQVARFREEMGIPSARERLILNKK